MDLLTNKDIAWTRFTGDDRFDYPIDYSGSLLNTITMKDIQSGRLFA